MSAAKKATRQANRLAKITARQSGRTDRAVIRGHAKEIAYQNGIDPGANMAAALGQGVMGVTGALSGSGLFGNKNDTKNSDYQGSGNNGFAEAMSGFMSKLSGTSTDASGTMSVETQSTEQNKTLMYVGIAVAAFLLLKRK